MFTNEKQALAARMNAYPTSIPIFARRSDDAFIQVDTIIYPGLSRRAEIAGRICAAMMASVDGTKLDTPSAAVNAHVNNIVAVSIHCADMLLASLGDTADSILPRPQQRPVAAPAQPKLATQPTDPEPGT